MPQLTYTTFDGEVHRHELQPGATRIGRTPDNDLPIDELAVSAHHCEICYQDGIIVVRDLDSAAGTFVDGEPITEREIHAGQTLGLGAFLVQLKGGTGPVESLESPAATPMPLADGSYSCLRHPTRRAVYECPKCFDLSCAECASPVVRPDGAPAVHCPTCGGGCKAIDWSGLTMTKKDALISLLPGSVQKAMDFWAKRLKKSGP
jgi:hypothetical protein